MKNFLLITLLAITSPFVGMAQDNAQPVTAQTGFAPYDFAVAYAIAADYAREHSGKVCKIAATRSMYPLLDWDTLVVLVPADGMELRQGDIVAVPPTKRSRVSSAGTLHRIYDLSANTLRLKGDRLRRPDGERYSREQVEWVAVLAVYFLPDGERPVIKQHNAELQHLTNLPNVERLTHLEWLDDRFHPEWMKEPVVAGL
jgi:hypothetical protein